MPSVSEFEKPKVAHARRGMYWAGPDRKYRLTVSEQNGGEVICPGCKSPMCKEKYTRKAYLMVCKECGFKVSSNNIVDKAIPCEPCEEDDIEIVAYKPNRKRRKPQRGKEKQKARKYYKKNKQKIKKEQKKYQKKNKSRLKRRRGSLEMIGM